MRLELLALIALMATVTYLGRALPLLVSGADRLGTATRRWSGLVAPATLAALATSNALLAPSGDTTVLAIGPLLPAVATALVAAAWRRSLPLAIAGAVTVAAILRSLS